MGDEREDAFLWFEVMPSVFLIYLLIEQDPYSPIGVAV